MYIIDIASQFNKLGSQLLRLQLPNVALMYFFRNGFYVD